MRERVDVVTGGALRYGLLPGTSPSRAAQELVQLAGGKGAVIRRAIERVQHVSMCPRGLRAVKS
jgi:hypothetical protein